MKIFLVVLFLALIAGMFYFRNKQVYDAKKSAPVTYTKALQHDVQKADDVQQKMSAAVQQTSQEVDKAAQEADPK